MKTYEATKPIFVKTVTITGNKAKTYVNFIREKGKPETETIHFRSLFLTKNPEWFETHELRKKFKDYYLFETSYTIRTSTLNALKQKMMKINVLKNNDTNISEINMWETIDKPPKVDGFYIVYSKYKNIWTKALYKMGEFHTIENEIDGCITHWKQVKKLPC